MQHFNSIVNAVGIIKVCDLFYPCEGFEPSQG